MAASINSSSVHPGQDLVGQTVLVIGCSSGIGLETARLARARGADIILTGRNPDRLHRAGIELGASIAAFDATDFVRLGRFFDALPAPVDHLLVTGPGPCNAPLAGFDLDAARRDVDAHLLEDLREFELLLERHRGAGRLLAVAHGGVENDDAVRVGGRRRGVLEGHGFAIFRVARAAAGRPLSARPRDQNARRSAQGRLSPSASRKRLSKRARIAR